MIARRLLPAIVALAAAAPVPPRLTGHASSTAPFVLETDPVVLSVGQEKRFLVGYWREPFCDDLSVVDTTIRTVSQDDNELRFRGLKPGKTRCRVSVSFDFDFEYVLIPIVVH